VPYAATPKKEASARFASREIKGHSRGEQTIFPTVLHCCVVELRRREQWRSSREPENFLTLLF
jgi:hypothetical protein